MTIEYEKKNKDAISTIKQALRQLSMNGVPVGNIIKAIKDIEEKYAESDDERIRGNIIATIHLYYGEPLEDEAKEMIAWLEKQGEQKLLYVNDNAKEMFIKELERVEEQNNKGYKLDAFIEKAAKWLEDNAIEYWGTEAVDNGMMIDDFKKEMKL